MLSEKVYRSGTVGAIPTYNEQRLRDIAGLDANRVADIEEQVDAAIVAFEQETSLKVKPSTFKAEFPAGGFTFMAGGTQAKLTVPGLNASIVSLTCNGITVDQADYETWSDDHNGSLHVEPAQGKRWDVYPSSSLLVTFTAGVTQLSAIIQEIVGVRMRYDYYTEEGDGIAFLLRSEPFNYLKSQR